MVKALIISNNLCFVKKLLNELDCNNLNIRISNISQSKTETFAILRFKSPDIIFLDKSLEEN